MHLLSSSFSHLGKIPTKYTCHGKGISPPLIIKEVPFESQSLVLIMEDIDAPKHPLLHWLLYNIPLLQEIKEESSPGAIGLNSVGEMKYFPPSPSMGEHRYFFKLYALSDFLALEEGSTKSMIEEAMENLIITSTQLIGLYGS